MPKSSSTIATIGFRALWRYEWQLKWQGVAEWLSPLMLFFMLPLLFVLAVGNEPQLLARLGAPVVWVAVLLMSILGIETLFKSALQTGILAQLVVTKASLPMWVLIRLTIHWLFSGALVAGLSVLTVPLYGLSLTQAGVLMATIVLGSPMLLMLCALASSLTVSLGRGAVLVSIIALPMQLPVLIFATGAVQLYGTGQNVLPVLALLGAGSIVSVLVMPWVIAFALKMAWTTTQSIH